MLLNLTSRRGAASESNLPDLHVRGKELPRLASSINDVDDTRRETLLDDLAESQCTERRLLRGLVNESVASCQRRLDGSWSAICT